MKRTGDPSEPAELVEDETRRDERDKLLLDVIVEASANWPNSFAKNVRQLCDGALIRSRIYRDTVRSETVMPSFSNSPWMRGAPQRQFDVAKHRMRD